MFGQIIDNAMVLQYKIECEASGMVDGDTTAFTVAERMQRLQGMRNAWVSGTPTETFPLQNKWATSAEAYVQYRPFAFGCVIAVCQVTGRRRCRRMLLIQVPSKYRNIDKKEWVLDNLCFDLPGLSIDHSQRLLVTAQASSVFFLASNEFFPGLMILLSGFVDNHVLLISILDSENGSAHPFAKTPVLETRTMSAYSLQIAGDYVGVLSESAYSFGTILQVWNWKTGEKVLVRVHSFFSRTSFDAVTVFKRVGFLLFCSDQWALRDPPSTPPQSIFRRCTFHSLLQERQLDDPRGCCLSRCDSRVDFSREMHKHRRIYGYCPRSTS